MKNGIILDGVCCAYCHLEEGCKVKSRLDNSRDVSFCSNYEKDKGIKIAKDFSEYPEFIGIRR